MKLCKVITNLLFCSSFISSGSAYAFTGGGQGGGGVGGAGGDFEIWSGQGGGVAGQAPVSRPPPGVPSRGTDGASDPAGTLPNGGKGGDDPLLITDPSQVIPEPAYLANPRSGKKPLNDSLDSGGGGGSLGVYIKTSTYNWNITGIFHGGTGGLAAENNGRGAPFTGGGGGGVGAVFEGDVLNLNSGILFGGDGANAFLFAQVREILPAGGGGTGLVVLKGIVNNIGDIIGGFGGRGVNLFENINKEPSIMGGQGGSGVFLAGATTLNNFGNVSNGDNYNTNVDSNPAVIAKGDGITIFNNENAFIRRTVRGGGQVSSTPAVWLQGSSNKVINNGTIDTDGGQTETAVEFNGNNNRMELWSKFNFTSSLTNVTHAVVANGIDNHLVLGGDAEGSFNLSDIGAAGSNSLFRGFTGYKKTGDSLWKLTGETAHAGNWALEQGMLDLTGKITGTMYAINGRLQGTGAVGGLTHESGATVSPGSNGSGTLTVNGDYFGKGGMVEFNTVLAADNSVTTRLDITGNTMGTSNVKVINRGGLGAPTINGIKLISVGGQSNGEFVLQGDFVTKDGKQAVIAEAYAYTLNKNTPSVADGDWYLRSSLSDGSDPGPGPGPNPDPGLGPNPGPNPDVDTGPRPMARFNPGAPLYEGAVQGMQQLNRLPTMQQRVGNRYWSGASGWAVEQGDGAMFTDTTQYPASGTAINGNGIWGRVASSHSNLQANVSTTGMHQKTNATILQAGIDGVFYEGETGRLVGGINGQYGWASSTIISDHGDGKVSTQAWGVGSALTWYGDNGFYADGQVQVNWLTNDYNSTTVRRRLADDQNAVGYALSAEAGKRFDINEYWSVTPQAQLMWSSVRLGSFQDVWNTHVTMTNSQSLIGRGGVSLDYRNAWQGADGRQVRTNIYGIANLYRDFMTESTFSIARTNFAVQHERTWGGLGLGGIYTWADDKYSVYGEGSVKTSLNNFGDNYELTGTVGFRVKW